MLLTLKRHHQSAACTQGRLYAGRGPGRAYLCDTLEPGPGYACALHRAGGAEAKGCVPDGFYQLVLTHSPRFGRTLPLLRHVPHFEGVRIHAGNTVHDTQGCILVGQALAPGRLRASRAALERLMRLLERGADSAIDIRTCLPAGPPPDRSAP